MDINSEIKDGPITFNLAFPVPDETVVQSNDYIEIEHGPNDKGDYILNISQLRTERPFPDNLKTFNQYIVGHLAEVLDRSVTKEITPPPAEWDFKFISIKACGLAAKWNFDSEDLKTPIENLLEDLRLYLDRLNPRKRRL